MLAVLTLAAALLPRPAAAAAASGIDTALLPISAADLATALRSNSHDSIQLVQLLRRADEQDLGNAAYETLRSMRAQQPKNATVLAAFCFAQRIAAGQFMTFPDHPHTRRDGLSVADYHDTLQEAIKLNPRLWLPYTLQGSSAVEHPDTMLKGLAWLREGVVLAPTSSFAHVMLANAYTFRPSPFMSLPLALMECRTAMSLTPVDSEAGKTIFWYYDAILHDQTQALKAKKALLAVLPPGAYLDPWTRERFAALP